MSTESMVTQALEPCPFCGDSASREFFGGQGWSIFCDGCHASAATLPAKSEAIAAWNTRTAAQPEREAVETVEVSEVETVAGDFGTDRGESFWRIEIDGYVADFDYQQAAQNVANAINARIARAALTTPAPASEREAVDFQTGVDRWMDACFGEPIKSDHLERADRLTEEALELVQTVPGFTADRAHALVDYVFGRPVGERGQEVGGTMVCLAALCNTFGLSITDEADRELARIWTKVEQIRAKQAAKPTGSALPVAALTTPAPAQKPHCSTCGKDLAEVLCETCGKWWADNPPPAPAVSTDEIVAEIRAHVENYDTPTADDPRRRYTVAQLETAIRRAILSRIRGEGETQASRQSAIAELCEGLEPFAKAAAGVAAFDPGYPMDGAALRASFDWYDKAQDEPLKRHSVRRSDLERARALLSKHSPDAPGDERHV